MDVSEEEAGGGRRRKEEEEEEEQGTGWIQNENPHIGEWWENELGCPSSGTPLQPAASQSSPSKLAFFRFLGPQRPHCGPGGPTREQKHQGSNMDIAGLQRLLGPRPKRSRIQRFSRPMPMRSLLQRLVRPRPRHSLLQRLLRARPWHRRLRLLRPAEQISAVCRGLCGWSHREHPPARWAIS